MQSCISSHHAPAVGASENISLGARLSRPVSSLVISLLLGLACGALFLLLALQGSAQAFTFTNQNENSLDHILHLYGYSGSGGELSISVGIDPSSENASDMVTAVRNVVSVTNTLDPNNGNYESGVLPGQYDFESVLLHELGHALGLGHPNLASESGLSGDDRNYTKSSDGANDSFDVDDGADDIIGSADDSRGDDDNFNWFRTSNNNPFTIASTVDSTTYSRDLGELPDGDAFSVNPDRDVGDDLGFIDSESVMQQGTFQAETQRLLGFDDVAGLRYAMAGQDETSGTSDDYTFTLTYAGLTTDADIVVDFDDSKTSFAVTQSTWTTISSGHNVLSSSTIYFNSGFSWYFNDSLTDAVPAVDHMAALVLALGLGVMLLLQRRRQNGAMIP